MKFVSPQHEKFLFPQSRKFRFDGTWRNGWREGLWMSANQRFRYEPQMAADAHRALLPETNLDSVLSIRESRTVAGDYTVRWAGAIYRVQREQIARGMRGARVQLEGGWMVAGGCTGETDSCPWNAVKPGHA
jgi:hypothetical protein